MSSFKRLICLACAFALISGILLPSFFTAGALREVSNVKLSDGSEWLISCDPSHNQLSTDGDGRYYVTTDANGTADSGFSLVSKSVYPLSSNFQLRCRESAGAVTHFGLTSEYSLEMKSSNSIDFIRQNGSPSENAVKIYITLNGKTECVTTTAASYTRNRVSTISVTKQNGSWYMKWNNIVLDGKDCSQEVQEYVKLENHFTAEALESGMSLHFFASCSNMYSSDSFSFKADRCISGGIMAVAADSYSDANNPATVTKTTKPSGHFEGETGTYSVTLPSQSTYAAVMSPVTVIDGEKGESEVFFMESFLENFNTSGQYWIEYSLSNDPTFSDGKEISFCTVKIANNGGVHLGYFNASAAWITCDGMNNNFFNDPDFSKRSWQFKTDSKTGKIYLYFWGANLTAANSPFCVTEDFSSLAGKPVYVRVHARTTGTATAKVNVTPYNTEEVISLINAADQTALKVPANLEEAEIIIAEYDSSAYRYAISDEGLSTILETRMYMFAEREKKLNAELEALKSRIDLLPSPEELESAYNSDIKDKICDTYLEYTALAENMSRLDQEHASKIQALVNKLSELDEDFAAKKSEAESFGQEVAEIKAAGKITVDNYTERSEKIQKLRELYDGMDDFLKSFVDSSAIKTLEELEGQLPAVKEAYDVTAMINALPEPEKIALSDEDAIVSARKAYNKLTDNTLIAAAVLTHLTDCEQRIESVKLTELDWYCSNSEVKYSGDNTQSYSFKDTSNEINGDIFAITTKAYDMSANQIYWVGMGCGSSQFMLLGLSSSVKGQKLSPSTTDSISFILRPGAGNSISITFFDAKGESENVGVISGFNLAGLHKFSFEKGEDGHWYIVVDGKRCDGYYYDRFDRYMETYGTSTYVSIGGRNGFKASNVLIADKNASEYTGDWNFSLPFGCSYTGDKDKTELIIKSGAQAVYKPVIDTLDKWSFTINTGLQNKQGSDTLVGFLASPNTNGDYSCSSDNGVVLRFINRPTASDYRTHILLLLNGKWITMTAKEPAIIDAESYTLTIEKSTDHHYYIRVRWASGTVLVKLDRTSEYYRLVQLDDLVENGAYFTFATNNNNVGAVISMKYSEIPSAEEEDENTTAAVGFILDFEKNFDKLNSRSKETFEYMYSEWTKLNFLTRNSVTADLMDDEAAYNLLLEVMNYKDGDLDEYYTVTEERLVSKNELDGIIAEYKSDDSADYVISFATDGTVIETIKNLSASKAIPLFSKEKSDNPSEISFYILSAAVICSVFGVTVVRRKQKSDRI